MEQPSTTVYICKEYKKVINKNEPTSKNNNLEVDFFIILIQNLTVFIKS